LFPDPAAPASEEIARARGTALSSDHDWRGFGTKRSEVKCVHSSLHFCLHIPDSMEKGPWDDLIRCHKKL
jgi:hypothetical protein